MFSADLPEAWAQGRSTFGGLVCGAALAAMQSRVGADRPPRSFHATFAGPVVPGPATMTVHRLGGGRSTTHLEARVRQGDVHLVAHATFGASRDSRLRVPPPRGPALAPPEGLPPLRHVEGVTPTFTQHLAYRFESGLPFSGGAEPRFGGWVRVPGATGVLDAALALALLDAWPPPPLAMLRAPAPASSASLAVSFTFPAAPIPADGWLAYRSRATWVADGWSDLRATLWTADRQQIATITQLFAIYA